MGPCFMDKQLSAEHAGVLIELNERLNLNPRAFALVVSGPSGVGKSSICEGVLEQDPGVQPCVTTTTRIKRPGEVEGVDYHFISDAAFGEKVARGEFIERAEVYGFSYGATIGAVSTALANAQVVLLDVDVQGAATWKEVFRDRCVTVFVLPPSIAVLKRRLEERKTEAKTAFRRRMESVWQEIGQAASYDYLIINHSLEQAILDLQAIIRAEKRRPWRMQDVLSGFGVSQGADDST